MYIQREAEVVQFHNERVPDHEVRALLRPSHALGRFLFNTVRSEGERTAKLIGLIAATDYGLFEDGTHQDLVAHYLRTDPSIPYEVRLVDCQGVALWPDDPVRPSGLVTDITSFIELAPHPAM